MKKRLLSLGLALVMLLSLLPTSVLATDYGYNDTKPTEYAVGDTVVLKARRVSYGWYGGYYTYDRPTNIPDGTRWERIGVGLCEYPDHWDDDEEHDRNCDFGYYAQFKLVSTAAPDPDEPDEPDDDTPGKVTADKDVLSKDPADDDTYTITLSVQGNKTTASTAVDSDVVLVVDTSSSMYNSRLSTAKNAALKFADELLGTGKNNRVAVIGFGCESPSGGENDSTAIRFSCGLKEAEDKKTVEDTINSITTFSNGIGTNYTAALAKAKELLDDADGNREGVVVFITDGAPGYYSSYDYWGNTSFNGKTQAAEIKDDYDLYTIGINISGTDLTNLNALSSGEDYHYNVTDSNMEVQLPAILTKIAYRINDVPAGTDVIMTDEINPAYFEVVGDADDVEIKPATADCDVSITDGKVILKFDEMPEETVTCYIKVKVKDNVLLTEAKKDVPTNKGVTLEYKDPDGAPEKMDEDEIGHPKVDIPANAATVTVKYVDEAGRSIHADLTGDVKFGETVNAGSTLGNTAVKQSITGYVYKESKPATGIQVAEDDSNVLTMVYQSNTLSVTYLPGTTETVSNMPSTGSVNYGEDYTVSDKVPTRAGYTFTGWKYNNTSTTYQKNDQIKNVTANITLTAQWRVRSDLSYTVNYLDKDTNQSIKDAETKGGQTYGTKIEVGTGKDVVPPTIDGYVFDRADKNSIIIGTDSNVINLYYEKVYTLTYDANGGSWGTSTTKDGGTHKAGNVNLTESAPTTLRSADSTGTNVVFLGWSTTKHDMIYKIGDTAPTDIVNSVTFTNADITVYAVWGYDDVGRSNDPADPNSPDREPDVNQAVVTFKVVNGTWDDYTAGTTTIKAVYAIGASLGMLPTATANSGFVNSGAWDDTVPTATTTAVHGAEYTYRFSQQLYDLVYDANGGSWGTGTSTVPTKTDATKYPKSNTPVNLTGEPDNARPAVSTEGTKVIFLGWSLTKQDKIYKNGDAVKPTIYDSVVFNDANIKNGKVTVYAVWGYDDVGRSNDPANPNQSDGKADVFQAVVTYTVVNGTWDGYTATTIKQVYDLYKKEAGVWTDQDPVLANVPTPTPATGYTDTVTWTKDGTSCAAPANGDAVTGNVTYKATYSTLATFSVTYDDGVSDSSVSSLPTPNPDSVTYNGTYTVSSTEPTRAGYTFTGWKYNNTSTTYQKNDQIKNVTANITLTAQWTDAYTLIYSNPLATGDTKSESKHDAAVTLAADQHGLTTPAAAGHTVVFVGWTNEANKVNKILGSGDTAPTLITSVNFDDDHMTQTVYAVWSYDDISSGTNGPDGSDNKPDVFQATVTYKVTDGTFVGGGTEKKVVFDLKEKKDGVWTALNPKLGDKPIPTPVAAEGYTGGAWTPTFTENTPVTGNKTYTYVFVPSSLTVDPTDPDGKSDTDDAWVKKQLTVRGSGFRSETFTVTVTPVVEGGESAGNISTEIGGSFEVVSTSYTGKVEMTGSDTKAFVFDEDNHITFHEAGKYLFTVKETAGSTRGMTYDTAEYTLEVNVVEGQNGLELGEVKTVTVKNSYYRASSSGSSGTVAKLEKGTHFNYVMGYSDGTIRPNKEITRGEVAIIFFRLLTDESRKEFYSEHNDFTDVPEDSKSNIAISTLTNAGILTGYSDGTFRPNAKVTRGQLAAIIARFADMKGDVDKTFSDIDGYWAKDLILLAASNGWIDGYSDGTFRPANNITRAQTMAIINRALDRQVSHVEDLLDEDVMNVWVDNMDPDAWYYFHVQEATNNHAYTRKSAASLDEKWTAKLKDIDWSVYQF